MRGLPTSIPHLSVLRESQGEYIEPWMELAVDIRFMDGPKTFDNMLVGLIRSNVKVEYHGVVSMSVGVFKVTLTTKTWDHWIEFRQRLFATVASSYDNTTTVPTDSSS